MPASSYVAQIQENTLGLLVQRAAASLPQTATTTFFNIVGDVEILDLVLTVTTAIQAQADAIKWRFTPTGGTVGDVSGTVDINGAVLTSRVLLQGPTDAGAVSQSPTLVQTTGATGKTAGTARSVRLKDGALALNAAASNTGAVSATLRYRRLSPGASVSAA